MSQTKTSPDQKSLRRLERSLPIALLRAREATMRKFRRHMDQFGLTLEQWRVIRAIADEPGIDSTTIAFRSVIQKPSVTRIMRTLQKKELVERQGKDSSRKTAFILTERGWALYQDAVEDSENIYRDIEAAFGRENMEEILRLLNLLRCAIEDIPDHGQTPVDG